MAINDIAVENGYLVITHETGRKKRLPIDPVLDQVVTDAEMPDMPIASLTLLTSLAQIMTIIVRTLVEQGILNEELVDGWDMQYVADTLVDDLDAEW